MRPLTISHNPYALPEARVAQPAETRCVQFPEGLVLESGARLAPLQLAYRSYGRLNRRRSNAILVVHALSGSASIESWWPQLIGDDKAINPDEHFVICANLLGSCYGSSGPLTCRPHPNNRSEARPYQADFPVVSVRDQVEAQLRLLNYLGINKLKAVIGPSLGGMIALEWALLHPQRVGALVLIATTAAHSAQALAQSELQRAAIRLDPDFNKGYYASDAQPQRGLALARQLAHVAYRSPQSLQQRFERGQDADGHYLVNNYLDHQGEKFCARFDANSYIRLTQCMNTHDLGRGRESCAAALQRITQPALILSIDSDQLYPLPEQEFIAQNLRHARHKIISSVHGHDGFLIETKAVNQAIAQFIRRHA